ncbi:3'-5' exonuclease [Candidatus Poriferisodalis sp.]|uniref:3'-5' exonuclease n=1 Tax=Candidatus Poriferisodalis sp. TaxID=3101277 RepID=UPI003B5BC1A8
MAFMQPENIASRNDVPQRLQSVAACLRDFLPGDVTVWLERTGNGETAALRREFERAPRSDDDGACYLVVLDRSAGIAVVESPTRRQVISWGRRRTKLNQDLLRREIAQRVASLQVEILRHSLETLPVRHVLGLPDVSRADASKFETRLPCLAEEDFAPSRLRDALCQAVGGTVLQFEQPARVSPHGNGDGTSAGAETGSDSDISEDELKAARVAVQPDVVIGTEVGRMFRPVDADSENVIRALDREQERLARHLGEGYRVIRGVAGSGKTLILIHRARHIARHLPEWRILLLCYNIPLASALGNELSDAPNVSVSTVDRMAYQLLRGTDWIQNESGRPDFEARRSAAAEIAASAPAAERYDMVLVDEAQDLGAQGLDLAWALLKPDRENLVIAHDGAQRIYRGKRRWNPPGRTAQGRTKVLKVNYRNTREILDAAITQLGDAVQRVPGEEQPDDFDVLVLPDRALRRGPVPLVTVCDGLRSEVEAVLNHVKRLRSARVPRDHIVILSGWKEFRQEVLRGIGPTASLDAQEHRDEVALATNVIRVATLQLLKGLEYRHVIVGGVNHIWVEDDEPAEQDRQRRRLLYVAMTRASETLTVTYSGDGIMNVLSQLPEFR